MAFTVACAQFAPRKHQIEANLDTVAQMGLRASAEGAELVVCPEACTSGYFLEGGVLECALEAEELADRLGPRLGALGRPLDLVVGFYERSGGDLYNSAAYLECGSGKPVLRHVYRKFFLPTYGVFDEERFVAAGRELGVFDTRLGRVGLLICEDVWHSILPTLAAVAGAQILVVPSASPARNFSGEQIGNLDRYARMLRAIGEEHGMYCVNCQLSGFEGGKGFVGGSSIVDPQGRVVAKSPVQEDHLLLGEIDLDEVELARASFPLSADLRTAWSDIIRLANDLR
ncbi:MAG: hypothetical protein M9921_04575 [Fimbriimonadaceae bacterium]|nr:hypothetical protein [Fimbriimonadaceae bacterium]